MMSSNNSNDWKSRYGEIIQELEESKAQFEANEKLLCRTIVQLTLATAGLDPAIDGHLARMRALLQKGIETERLRAELEAITATLIRGSHDEPKSGGALVQQAPLLFRFLHQITFGRDERSALTQLQASVESGELVDAARLFVRLREILRLPSPGSDSSEEQERAKGGLLGRWLARNGGKLPEGRIEIELVRERLLSMLAAIQIPSFFRERAENIKQRLGGSVEADALQDLLNESIDFLSEVKSFIQQEQQEIESFLAVLTGRLSELEHQASGADASAQAVVKDLQAGDYSYRGRFDELKAAAREVSDLSSLKNLLAQRLDQLSEQFRTDRERDLNQLQATQQQLGSLSGRLQELELETNDLRSKLRLAHDLALRDPLTGLPNRKAYDERINQEIARWRRFRHPLCLLVWDVDHFKNINDRFGHAAGDKVLGAVAGSLGKSIRETDFVARYGGEEFVMILCGADGQAASRVADQIRRDIAAFGFNSQGRPVAVTISCGIAEYCENDTAQGLFERADQALYDAKAGGRDRCVLH